jgi:post-segregation antitoxin (ccd killing protein)
MSQGSRSTGQLKKRRTTLTLPADSLMQAERIADVRKVNLSTAISEALSEGLRLQAAREHSEEVLNAYKAFSGFSHEEMLILDGVMLEPVVDQ